MKKTWLKNKYYKFTTGFYCTSWGRCVKFKRFHMVGVQGAESFRYLSIQSCTYIKTRNVILQYALYSTWWAIAVFRNNGAQELCVRHYSSCVAPPQSPPFTFCVPPLPPTNTCLWWGIHRKRRSSLNLQIMDGLFGSSALFLLLNSLAFFHLLHIPSFSYTIHFLLLS